LVSEGRPDAASIENDGNRFLSGNGKLGLRGTLDEQGKEAMAGLVVNGLYDRAGAKWREPVNAPIPLAVRLFHGGLPLSAAESPLGAHVHGIDFRRGLQFRDSEFLAADGAPLVRLRSRRFVSMAEDRLLAAELRLEAAAPVELVLRAGIDGEVWDINGPHLTGFAASADPASGALVLDCRTGELGVPLRVVSLPVLFPAGADAAAAADGRLATEGPSVYREWRLALVPGAECRLELFGAVRDDRAGGRSRRPGRRVDGALAAAKAAAAAGFAAVLAAHDAAWERRWAAGEAGVEGDDEADRALKYSLYQLNAAAPDPGEALSIPARGLSGQVYKGAVFWDTELFMLPYFAAANPRIARGLLDYRIATLDGARLKAAEYGYRGAYYAWESQETGDDACTLFNVNDVFTGRPLRTFFRDKQIHISADVAWAVRLYLEATGDESILLAGGAEVVFECARFLADWAYWKPGKKRYELLDVTGPDEYHERVNNDFYTNRIAAECFAAFTEIDARLAAEYPAFRSELYARLGAEADLDFIRSVAAGLFRPSPDPVSGIIAQFDGYADLEDVSLAELMGRKLRDNEYLGGGDGLARWTRIIKQADVALALALFPGDYPEEALRANYDYYDVRTEHGSSLSASAYAVLAARLGRTEDALAYFMKTASVDLAGDGKRWVGDLYIGGTHPAANGGAWLALARGFCGLDFSLRRLRIRPKLPAAWKAVVLNLAAGEASLTVKVMPARLELSCAGRLPDGFAIETDGGAVAWDGSSPLAIKL
jgi:trehalose/maltose hydrolase-like predicted phosphorylase